MKTLLSVFSARFSSTITVGATILGCAIPLLNAQPNCATPPSGLIGWWRAEGNGNDSVGGNNGTLQNVSFTTGQVGQAFDFDPQAFHPVRLSIPDQPVFKLTNSLTIEGWIQPRGFGYCVFFRGDNRPGLDPYVLTANDVLSFYIQDENGNVALVDAPIAYNQWWHVAATLDGSSGDMKLYVNGALVSQTNTTVRPMGDLDPGRDPAIGIGNVGEHFNDFPFNGEIDEIALYSRALSQSEIQGIYNAGSAGKCVTSPPPSCIPPPDNLVSWWRGEGNALDQLGGNNGILVGGVTYVPGKVGQGFRFNGVDSFVRVPHSPSLSLSNQLTLEMWYKDEGSVGWNALIAKRTTAAPSNYGIHIQPGGAQGVEVFFHDKTLGGFSVSDYVPVPASGVFHHLAATFKQVDATHVELKTFIDGVLVKTAVVSGNLANTLNFEPVTIGAEMGYAMADFFKGVIDEVAIYNRALSAGEIQAIYDAGSAGKCEPTPPSGNCVNSPAGLVSWWRGENSTADAADGNNGTLAGNTTYGAGRVGQGFVLDGSGDGVNVGNPPNLQLQDFTIESWIKRAHPTRATQSSALNGTMFSGPVGGYGFGLWDDGRIFLSKIGVSGVFSTAKITDTTNFHHVAVTKSGSNVVLYVDGVAESVGPYDPGFAFNGPMAIGARGGDYGGSLYGAIDEVSIYNRALAASEIRAIFDAGSAGKCEPTPPPVCVPVPDNLVSWWRAEGNAYDEFSGNDGSLVGGVSYAPGKVGQGFKFNGVDSFVRIPHSPSLSLSNQLTLEMWYKDEGSVGWNALIAKRTTAAPSNYGIHIQAGGGQGVEVFFHDKTLGGFSTSDYVPVPASGVFHHLAATFKQVDASHVELKTFVDGVLVKTAVVSGNLENSLNAEPVTIGAEMGYVMSDFFKGVIDEVAIYNRALSAGEIQAIYDADSLGKCVTPTAPVISVQPTNQTVLVGRTVAFNVSATGSPLLTYQWRLDGLNLSGRTTASLVLTNVQLTDAGTYSVVISNGVGHATSLDAVLTVNSPVCATVPADVVSWWRGEGNGLDELGGNDGSLVGGVTYAPGKVGQGFKFNGVDSFVRIPHSPSLSLSNQFTLEMWYKDEGSVGWNALIAKRTTAAPSNYGIHIQAGGGQGVEVFFHDQTLGGFSTSDYVPVPASGVFHHLAATFKQVDASHVELKTFIDGALVKTSVVSGNLANAVNAEPVTIGAEMGYAMADFFKGVIDEVAIYNRALSASEIHAIYDADSLGKCAPTPPPVCVPAPDHLVGWWRAEGNGNDSVGGNDGTLQNVTFTAGQVGQAFNFDPQAFRPVRISIPDQPVFKLTNSLSIEGWIRPRGVGYCVFYRGDNRVGLDPYLLSMEANNVLGFYIQDANGGVASINAPLIYNQWWHVAATLDGNTGDMKLYVNGALINQTNTTVRPMGDLDPNRDPAIGIGNVGEHFNDFPFNGEIDEIALYSRALSQSEIQGIYNAGSAGKCVPPPPVNQPPVADPSATLPLIISVNNSNATVVLDGSRSSDPDGDPLQYRWFVAGAADPLAAGVVAVVTLPVGSNALILTVDDGLATDSQPFVVEVITPAQAVERLVALVNSGAPKPHPLIASLNAALAAIDRSNPTAAINQLQAFQNKVRSQVMPLDPELAEQFIQAAQEIIDALSAGNAVHGKLTLDSNRSNGKAHLKFEAPSGPVYIVESSTDLVTWEKIGVMTSDGNGAFEFEDTNATGKPARFYRIVVE